jgi:LPXTG-motif cell wall-anchored protein
VRPLVPAGALLLLCAATPALATPALAATTAAKPAGSASSSVGLLSVTAGGHTFDVATLELLSDTISATPTAKVVVTPLIVDGTAYGQQTVTPSSGETSIPALPSSGLAGVPGLVEVVAPAITASADTSEPGPRSSAGAASLGSLDIMGLPVALGGSAQALTGVTATAATATKQISVTDLSLPSIADLLAGLGLDLSAVPVDALVSLVDELELAVTSAFETAMVAVDEAQGQLDAASDALDAATAELAAATTVVDTAVAALTTALAGTGLTEAAYAALPQPAKDLLPAGVATAYSDLLAARSLQAVKDAAVDTAQALVDTLQATLATVLETLFDAVHAILDGTPLLSLDSLEVSTKALATSDKAGGQEAVITGGEIAGLQVLGTDVLDTVLGTSTVDLVALTSGALADVTTLVDELTGTLAGVLSDVAGLELTAPVVDVLGKATRTGVVGGFGEAETLVSALSITLPRITLPTALALPGAGDLPVFDGVTAVNGVLSSLSGSVDLVTLRELSKYRPAVVAAPTAPTPNAPTLPSTGGSPLGAVGGLLLLTAAGGLVAVRRRTAAA